MRAAVERFDGAPEGIELYRWLWVPASYRSYLIPVYRPLGVSFMGDEIDLLNPGPRSVVEITPVMWVRRPPDLAWVGWSEDERIAVLFYADGGPEPERLPTDEPISDTGIQAIAHSGYDVLISESRKRILELLDELLDELGYSDGEEWKRER